jgi:hypothetical protein
MKAANIKKIEAQTLELLSNEDSKRIFVNKLLSGLSDDALDSLAERLFSTHEDTAEDLAFANKLRLPHYSEEERKSLEWSALVHFFDYRKKLLAGAIPSSQVAEMLGVSRQTPHDRARAEQMLGILDNNVLKFPKWQFDPQGPNGLVAGLSEVLAALKCGTFAKISWLASSNQVFQGMRPIDALKKGLLEEVIHEAGAVGAS